MMQPLWALVIMLHNTINVSLYHNRQEGCQVAADTINRQPGEARAVCVQMYHR
jgi:hypothetical protein